MIKKLHLIKSGHFGVQLMHSHLRTPFTKDNNDWFIKYKLIMKVTNYLSALYLKYLYRDSCLPMNIKELSALIDQISSHVSERV